VPDDPDVAYASMGNYVFSTAALIEALKIDAADESSIHDMGGNIIPYFVNRGSAHVYDFDRNVVPGATSRDRGYWRDVGTMDAYMDAHMDLVSLEPIFNLYNREWPILSFPSTLPPAKFVENGTARDSMIGSGTIISGATVTGSVVSDDVRIGTGSRVEGSVILPGVRIGRNAVVRHSILDKNVIVPDGAKVGVDVDLDSDLYTVSPGGITVVGKGVTIGKGPA
jgi:glucose-1-phosphate adenylyltransferase